MHDADGRQLLEQSKLALGPGQSWTSRCRAAAR